MKKLVSGLLVVVLALCIVVVPSSVDAALGFVQKAGSGDTPGIISGLWHGLVAPYGLILGIFNQHIGMYAYPNTGWAYDLGFLLGVGGSLTGGGR